jgi:hypothetical protein
MEIQPLQAAHDIQASSTYIGVSDWPVEGMGTKLTLSGKGHLLLEFF